MNHGIVISRDGTPIGYTRTGSGPPLVMVHGITADAARWAPVLPALSEHYTVYAMDRRGRGTSGDAPDHAIEREQEDVAAVVTSTGAPTLLFGHSYGGVCALGALLLTSHVQRLVVYEPYTPLVPASEPSSTTLRFEAMVADGDPERLVVTFLREVLLMGEREVAAMRAQPSWAGRVASAHTIPREMRAAEHHHFDPARFRDVTIPIGMLVGGESVAFLKEATARLHAALPTSKVVVLPGQQHAAMNTAPALFVGELRALLDG